MIKLSDYINSIKDKKIAVIGFGVSNKPLIRLLAFAGCNVTVCDARNIEQLGFDAFEMLNLGVKLKLGEDYLNNPDYDIIFRTPGLMPYLIHPVNPECVITSEMELFFKVCPCRVIAVTGSDGKTTTTTIISELLKKAGYGVHLGGNIGKPLLCEAPMMKSDDIAVVELSSFQLHSMVCAPDIAVITNITPNHLDKHKDLEDYINSKKQIYVNQKPGSKLILNADDELVSTFGGTSFFSTEKKTDGACCLDGKIYRGGRYVMNSGNIKLPGLHNIKNYLAAFAATEGFVPDDACVSVAESFAGVPHRLETVCMKNGVTFINDSIASSPARTIAGLRALKNRPIVIAGGHDKNVPFDELAAELIKRAGYLVLTGETAYKIESAVNELGGMEHCVIEDFDTAVLRACEMAGPGDTVLLSPACSSFDHFKNFEERGERFRKIVTEFE